MAEDIKSIEAVETEALEGLNSIDNKDNLSAWRGQYLGNKGTIRGMLGKIGTLPKEERGAYGQGVNALKNRLTEAYEAKLSTIEEAQLSADLEGGAIDVTLPGRARSAGRVHPKYTDAAYLL